MRAVNYDMEPDNLEERRKCNLKTVKGEQDKNNGCFRLLGQEVLHTYGVWGASTVAQTWEGEDPNFLKLLSNKLSIRDIARASMSLGELILYDYAKLRGEIETPLSDDYVEGTQHMFFTDVAPNLQQEFDEMISMKIVVNVVHKTIRSSSRSRTTIFFFKSVLYYKKGASEDFLRINLNIEKIMYF